MKTLAQVLEEFEVAVLEYATETGPDRDYRRAALEEVEVKKKAVFSVFTALVTLLKDAGSGSMSEWLDRRVAVLTEVASANSVEWNAKDEWPLLKLLQEACWSMRQSGGWEECPCCGTPHDASCERDVPFSWHATDCKFRIGYEKLTVVLGQSLQETK